MLTEPDSEQEFELESSNITPESFGPNQTGLSATGAQHYIPWKDTNLLEGHYYFLIHVMKSYLEDEMKRLLFSNATCCITWLARSIQLEQTF